MRDVQYFGSIWFLILVSFLTGNAAISFAGGPVHGAKGAGMGTAFSAVADDPSAILSNPAGLTQLEGTNIYGGNTFVIPSTSFRSPSGQEEDTAFQIFFPPHVYAESDLGTKDLRVGLGVYSPFGIGGRKWSETGLTRYLSTKNQIATVTINPTVAYRVTNTLSIAGGFDYMYSRNDAEKMVDQSLVMGSDGKAVLKADGWGWGLNGGILFMPAEEVSLAFAYRSRIKVNHGGSLKLKNIAPPLQSLFGAPEFRTDINTTMTFPEIFTFGAAYRPLTELTLSVEAEDVRWSSFKSSDLHLGHEVPQAGLVSRSSPFNWRDVWDLKVGMEYRATEKLALRLGYAYVPTPVPENTLDPANPDSNQHNFSVGIGCKRGKMILDFFYMAGFYERRKVTNDILSGSYDNFAHYIGLSVGYRF